MEVVEFITRNNFRTHKIFGCVKKRDIRFSLFTQQEENKPFNIL